MARVKRHDSDDPWLIVSISYASVYSWDVDTLSGLLDGPRARGAFLLRCLLDAPWAIRLQDEAPLSVTAVTRGTCGSASTTRTRCGWRPATSSFAWTDSWTIADDPRTDVQVLIEPGQVCVSLDGQPLVEEMAQGVRSWGNSTHGETVLLTGVYLAEGEVSLRLLRALPPTLVLPSHELDTSVVDLLAAEVVRDAPGQDAVLDRLLDLLVISVLRTWLDRPQSEPPAWYAAQSDRVVGPPLRLMQHHPDEPWTVSGSLPAPGCHVPRSPAASPRCSGSHRWRSSPHGGSLLPLTSCSNPTRPSPPSPIASATPRRTPSVPPSNASAVSARAITVESRVESLSA